MSQRLPFVLVLACVLAAAAVVYAIYQPPSDAPVVARPKVSVIVGGPEAFWTIVGQGAREAADQYDVELTVDVPDGTGDDQTRHIVSIDAESVDGVAISPLAPLQQTRDLSLLASKVKLITFDNDAPLSLRLCHVGTNNWTAGQLRSDLVKIAIPDGGKIVIFVGDLERENARHRIQGLLAGLEDRRPDPENIIENLDDPITIGPFTVAEIYLDGSNPEEAKKNAKKALDDHPDMDCMVGLYGYNGPMCLEALKEAETVGEIQLVAFDEHEPTLDGIAAGEIVGSVIQDPYQYGFESVRILADLSRGKAHAVPMAGRGSVYLPCSIVTAENLEEFRDKLAERTASIANGD